MLRAETASAARRQAGAAPPGAVAAGLGGDEFTLLMAARTPIDADLLIWRMSRRRSAPGRGRRARQAATPGWTTHGPATGTKSVSVAGTCKPDQLEATTPPPDADCGSGGATTGDVWFRFGRRLPRGFSRRAYPEVTGVPHTPCRAGCGGDSRRSSRHSSCLPIYGTAAEPGPPVFRSDGRRSTRCAVQVAHAAG
jgi:hypothetical protein